MRFGRLFFLFAIVALSLLELNGLVSSREVRVVRRQEQNGISTSVSSLAGNDRPSPTSSVPVSTGTTENDNRASSPTSRSVGHTPSATSTGIPEGTVAASDPGASSDPSAEDAVYKGGLPIKPKVTPGIAVAGVALLLAGAPYCLIGIKIKFLQIFLSTFFLSGLGVTVLIVYVMNPPVRDAIQGAYVTAVIMTGILTGGLAVIFPEVTEALGCLLGGFCVSMWFLVLKPGGLVDSIYGKLIIFAVFCTLTFGLAFHRITKPYTLIFSLSFSGATAIVLGIDCFSRAGLKEFWIYVWDLNNNIFPLDTNTYPHTRGIRVEIAVIILITAFGIMSQVKLWKILKERRDTKDAEKRQQRADLEALNEDVGRRVEEAHREERAQWEMTYGGKSAEVTVTSRPNTGKISGADSGIGEEDTRKKSGEVAEEFVESEEMRKEREGHLVTEGVNQPLDAQGQQASGQEDQDMIELVGVDQCSIKAAVGVGPHHDVSESTSLAKPTVSQAPEVIPLPIPMLMEDDDEDDASSLATWAGESVRSGGEDRMLVDVITTPKFIEEAFDQDEDKASSLAATLDEEDNANASQADLPSLSDMKEVVSPDDTSPTASPATDLGSLGMTPATTPDTTPKKGESQYLPLLGFKSFENGKDSVVSSWGKGIFTEDHSGASSTHQTTPTITSPPSIADTSLRAQSFSANLAPASFPKEDGPGSSTAGIPQLPARCSKVVKTYRTNEWALHLDDAEKPDLEDLEAPVQEASGLADEIPAPVHVRQLQQTSDVPSLPTSRAPSRLSFAEQMVPTSAPSNGIPSSTTTPVRTQRLSTLPQEQRSYTPSPAGRSSTPGRRSSIPAEHSSTPDGRSSRRPFEHSTLHFDRSSTPVGRSMSPAERCISPPARQTPSPLPQNTLIGKRESIIYSRQNFTPLPEEYDSPQAENQEGPRSRTPGLINHPFMNQRKPTPHPVTLPAADNANSSSHQYRAAILNDDMTLRDRRNELINSASHNGLSQGHQASPAMQKSVNKRESQLQLWRDTIKLDPTIPHRNVKAASGETGEIPTERRQQILAQRAKEAVPVEVIDERMREQDMLDLHREAMRKMQADANKHFKKK